MYDSVTQCTTGLCTGLGEGEFEQFIRYLSASLEFASNPMLLPMVFIDFLGHMTARWLTYNRLSLLGIAKSREINIREYQDNRGFGNDKNLDLDSASRKLTLMNDEYAIIESISKTQLRFLQLIEKINLERCAVFVGGSELSSLKEKYSFVEEISFLRQTFNSALQNVDRDRQNIQGLAQTVCSNRAFTYISLFNSFSNHFYTDTLPYCAERKSTESDDCDGVREGGRRV